MKNGIISKEAAAASPLSFLIAEGREEDPFRYDKEKDQVQCPAGQWTIKKAKPEERIPGPTK